MVSPQSIYNLNLSLLQAFVVIDDKGGEKQRYEL
jgi:hypothetical protein